MATFDIVTLLLLFLAVFSFINARFVKLPPIIAFTLGSLGLAGLLLLLQWLGLRTFDSLIRLIEEVDFSTTVLSGILSFLLFAGSLQLDIRRLAEEKWVIFTLATFGVILSTFLVGTAMWGIFYALSIPVPYLYALVFGALISPTDPVIVIGLLKKARIPSALKAKVMGEALFNDGISIVLFVVLLTIATFGGDINPTGVLLLLVQQLLGSAILGLLSGWVTYHLLAQVKKPSVQIMISVGLVAGCYDLAAFLNMSGPITVVIMGLIVRNYRKNSFGELYAFWNLIDEFLNGALFILMGLQLLALPFTGPHLVAAVCAILVVLAGRYFSVLIPISLFRLFRPFTKNVVLFLTWVGLRGGVSLALALSLPGSPITHAIWSATFFVVIFSTVVQGLTFRSYITRDRNLSP
jgi:Na+:H+ antiporter